MQQLKMMMQQLTLLSWRARLDPRVHTLAREVTDSKVDRQDKIRALVNELHRRFVVRTDPSVDEFVTVFPPDGAFMDADDACLFVAAAAMSVGIPCRIVAVRYGPVWSCLVQYEAGLIWETIDPLRQKLGRDPDELVVPEPPHPKELLP
jgi:hypothetical protein